MPSVFTKPIYSTIKQRTEHDGPKLRKFQYCGFHRHNFSIMNVLAGEFLLVE